MANTITESLNTSSERTFHYYHDDHVELMPTWGYAASAFVLFLIGFFGFFLNLMVIVLMCKDKQLWTPLNVILFNLVCSDFSVSILGNPFTLISALSHRWVFGKTMCIVYGFFMSLLGITSITTLTVLSFERYRMVSRPLASHRLSMRGAWFSICLIWGYSFVVTTPPLYGWGSYVNEAANISCSINWEEQTFNALTYILFLFATGLILPVIVITFSYLNILKTMKKNAVRVGRVAKAESRVTVMVFIMIVTFIIAWTPYSILALIEQFAPRDLISPGLGVVPALIAKSSICYDPIIYVGMNTQFRTSLKKIFGFGDNDDSLHDRGIDNTLMSPMKAISQNNDNITLRHMKPREGSLTIHRDSVEKVKITDETCRRVKPEGPKKKITLMTKLFSEESSEISGESLLKDLSSIDTVRNASDDNSKNDSNPIVTDSIYNHSKKVDEFEAKQILLKFDDENNRTDGHDNLASNFIWDEVNEGRRHFEGRIRRKSSTNVHGYELKAIVDRRKSFSSGITPGYMRKFTSATHDSRGNVLTRLIVDERDRSKLLCFEEIKSGYAYENKKPDGEQMM